MTKDEINELWRSTVAAGPKGSGMICAAHWLKELNRIININPEPVNIPPKIDYRIPDLWSDVNLTIKPMEKR